MAPAATSAIAEGHSAETTIPASFGPTWVMAVSGASCLAIMVIAGLQRSVFVHPGLRTALVVMAGAPWLLGRRGYRIPWWVTTLIVTFSVGALIWTPLRGADTAPFFLVYLAGYVSTTQPPRFSVVAALLAAGPIAAAEISGRLVGNGIWFLAIGMGWFFGAGFRWQLTMLDKLRDAQAGLAERAAGDERRRIAGELHDLLGHTLTVTTLHLSAARLALEEGQNGEAIEALTEAERAAREAMVEIRGAVNLLGPQGGTRSLPTAAEIPSLVADFARAGLDVDLSYDLADTELNASAGLTLYRVVQEALTNAAKHSPGQPVRIVVGINGNDATVTAENPLPAGWRRGDAGLGVPGITERAASAGGRASVGPDSGRWVVEVAVPVGAVQR